MANVHFGNLANVFKHLALCEAMGFLRLAEYWESHAGAASYAETGTMPAERAHGVHHFAQLVAKVEELRFCFFGKALAATTGAQPPVIPGSPLLARFMIGDNPRRMLLCDTDADTLQNVQRVLGAPSAAGRAVSPDKLECIPDDGISVLRGAGVLLPETWGASTFALIDPYEMEVATAAGISPLELACELANRAIVTLLFYTFRDEPGRHEKHQRMLTAMEKARLLNRGACRFEGSLKAAPEPALPTQWGFGLMAFNLAPPAAEMIHQKLRALQRGYEDIPAMLGEGISGNWNYARAGM